MVGSLTAQTFYLRRGYQSGGGGDDATFGNGMHNWFVADDPYDFDTYHKVASGAQNPWHSSFGGNATIMITNFVIDTNASADPLYKHDNMYFGYQTNNSNIAGAGQPFDFVAGKVVVDVNDPAFLASYPGQEHAIGFHFNSGDRGGSFTLNEGIDIAAGNLAMFRIYATGTDGTSGNPCIWNHVTLGKINVLSSERPTANMLSISGTKAINITGVSDGTNLIAGNTVAGSRTSLVARDSININGKFNNAGFLTIGGSDAAAKAVVSIGDMTNSGNLYLSKVSLGSSNIITSTGGGVYVGAGGEGANPEAVRHTSADFAGTINARDTYVYLANGSTMSGTITAYGKNVEGIDQWGANLTGATTTIGDGASFRFNGGATSHDGTLIVRNSGDVSSTSVNNTMGFNSLTSDVYMNDLQVYSTLFASGTGRNVRIDNLTVNVSEKGATGGNPDFLFFTEGNVSVGNATFKNTSTSSQGMSYRIGHGINNIGAINFENLTVESSTVSGNPIYMELLSTKDKVTVDNLTILDNNTVFTVGGVKGSNKYATELKKVNMQGGSMVLGTLPMSEGALIVEGGRNIGIGTLEGGGTIHARNNTVEMVMDFYGDDTSKTFDYRGVIRDGDSNAKISIEKTGFSTQILGGANTFTGSVSAHEGILFLNHNSVSSVLMNGGGFGSAGNLKVDSLEYLGGTFVYDFYFNTVAIGFDEAADLTFTGAFDALSGFKFLHIDELFEGDDSALFRFNDSILPIALQDVLDAQSAGTEYFYTENGVTYLATFSFVNDEFYVNFILIPEPSTYALMFGFLALAFAAWKRRK